MDVQLDQVVPRIIDLANFIGGALPHHPDLQREIVESAMRDAANPADGAVVALRMLLRNPDPTPSESSWVWSNGVFTPAVARMIPLNSPTVHYGRGAFEGIFALLHEGELLAFRLAEHFERFKLSAKTQGLECPFTVDQLCDATSETLLRNNIHQVLEDPKYKFAYIRPLLYRNNSELRGIETSSGPNVVVIEVIPWEAYVKDDAFRLKSFDAPVLYDYDLAAIKANGKYVLSHRLKVLLDEANAASEIKYNEGLLINPYTGAWIELSAENICVLTADKRLLTPDKGALRGITLDTVCALAPRLGYTPERFDITTDYLKNLGPGGEVVCVFACGSAAGLKRVAQIDDWNLDSERSTIEFTGFKGMYQTVTLGLDPEYEHWVTRVFPAWLKAQ